MRPIGRLRDMVQEKLSLFDYVQKYGQAEVVRMILKADISDQDKEHILSLAVPNFRKYKIGGINVNS